MTGTDDNIAVIARDQQHRHGAGAMRAVEERIATARQGCDWQALTLWHRVRYRMLRTPAPLP